MPEANGCRPPALLVFSDDWGRYPSSCQHLVRRLLQKYEVYWVNTIGMRRPAIDWLTLVRGAGKLREWFVTKPAAPSGNPRIVSPKMWPWFSGRGDRWLNRTLLTRQLRKTIRSLASPVIGITTLPIVADLLGSLPVSRWVYYCVDDFTVWPGLDHAAIREMETHLVRHADVLIAASPALQTRLRALGRESELLTHGVDLDDWQPVDADRCLPLLHGLERPLMMFWGVLDRRMDTDFIQRLARDMNRGTIVLVGPEADADPAIAATPRVVRVPQVPFADLPRLAAQAAALIMPYADLPVTRAMQPLKLKEYLATGKPVIVRDLPANRDWSDALDIVGTAKEFSALVRRRLADGLPDSQRAARLRLAQETWDAKARCFEQMAILAPPSLAQEGLASASR